jgi:hypothetical protein
MNKYYAVLGLPTTASKDEVRRKYRKLVLLWHPDRNSSPEAHGKFIAITEAYDVLMGERPAPRTQTFTRPYSSAAVRPKTREELQKEKRVQRDENLRLKFENIRAQHLRAPDFQKRKDAMYAKSTLYFIGAGSAVVLAIFLPLTIIPLGNLTWSIPVSIAAGLQLLWRGGRIKLRADMIYGGKTNYTTVDIREFFMEGIGYKFQPPAGSSRWP